MHSEAQPTKTPEQNDSNTPPPHIETRNKHIQLTAGVIAMLVFVGATFWLTLFLRHASQNSGVLHGVPLRVDDQAMKRRATDDTKFLLAQEYDSFYAQLGAKSGDSAATARRDFAAAIDNVGASGDCTPVIDKLDKKQGSGLDSNPNSVTASVSVACKTTSYRIQLLFYGSNKQPETFRLFAVTTTSSSATFVAAVAKTKDARLTLISSDKNSPSDSITTSVQTAADAERLARSGTLGTGCTLDANPTATLTIGKALDGDITLTKALVAYHATCDTINS